MRVDAGFVAGDEVSAHYDPMIAKLIVQGETRESAIQKLKAALEDYEIAGPTTNIEFLKRICQTPAFKAGEVETGFIGKWKDSLFRKESIRPEVFAQAAIGAFYSELLPESDIFSSEKQSGLISSSQTRSFRFLVNDPDGKTDATETAVAIQNTSAGLFHIFVGEKTYDSVASTWDSLNLKLTTYFPYTRLETRFINDSEGNITLFQQGRQYRLRYATPKWIEKALGVKDAAHSVLSPMPCKILKVHVKPGEEVKKEQVLVVIESMKMETSIRSPQDGVVSRVVHQEGVRVAAVLVVKNQN